MKWMKTIRWAGAVALAVSGTAAFAQSDAEQFDDQSMMQDEGSIQSSESYSDELIPSDQQPVQPQTNVDVNVNQGTGGSGTMEATAMDTHTEMQKKQNKNWVGASSIHNQPVSIKVGGGIEGQGQRLDEVLAPGPMWSAYLGLQPAKWLGFEAGYTGAVFELDNRLTGENNDGAVNGADFVRNGGELVATVGLPIPVLQPYAVGGVGIDRYEFRGTAVGFDDDTAGRAPVGGGLRTTVGPLTADARATYNVLWDQDFVPAIPNNDANTYNVSLNVGARF